MDLMNVLRLAISVLLLATIAQHPAWKKRR
jgi:hypothetical protein